jgi:uncharacterized membrane protein YbhN (UPF0104 family)
MTNGTRTVILYTLAVLLAPVLILFLLAVSFTAGELLCARIYRGSHEGISDLCGIVSTLVIFFVLLVGSVAAVVVPAHRLLRLKYGLGVRKSDPSR